MRRHRHHVKKGGVILLIGGALLLLSSALPHPAAAAPAAPQRLLVISPHPDDESLAAAGLIDRTLAAGGRVRIAVLTNGDGFRAAAARLFGIAAPRPADLYRLGVLRQKEELACATRHLGLQPQDVTLLGYPDAGLHQLWDKHWQSTMPYLARNGYDHVPYKEAYHRFAPYSGESVVGDLRRLIDEFQPTDVLYPNAHDIHKDHWATGVFTQYALAGMKARPREWSYLVHFPGYPEPRRFRPHLALVPPASLRHIGISWQAVPLSDLQKRRKHQAILAHRSQIKMMRDLLESFVRTNELVATTPAGVLARLPAGAQPFHTTEPLPHTILHDPRHDQSQPNSPDIVAVATALSGDRLQLCIETVAPLDPHTEAAVHMRLPDRSGSTESRIDFHIKQSQINTDRHLQINALVPADCFAQIYKNRYIIYIPAQLLEGSHSLLINTELSSASRSVDQTAWQKVRLNR